MRTTSLAVLLLLLILPSCRTRGGSLLEFGEEGDGASFSAPRDWAGTALIQGALARGARGGDACISVVDPCTGKSRPVSIAELEAMVARIQAADFCPEATPKAAPVGIQSLVVGTPREGGVCLTEGELLRLLESVRKEAPAPEPIAQVAFPAPAPLVAGK